jgi:hypothetical protein
MLRIMHDAGDFPENGGMSQRSTETKTQQKFNHLSNLPDTHFFIGTTRGNLAVTPRSSATMID